MSPSSPATSLMVNDDGGGGENIDTPCFGSQSDPKLGPDDELFLTPQASSGEHEEQPLGTPMGRSNTQETTSTPSKQFAPPIPLPSQHHSSGTQFRSSSSTNPSHISFQKAVTPNEVSSTREGQPKIELNKPPFFSDKLQTSLNHLSSWNRSGSRSSSLEACASQGLPPSVGTQSSKVTNETPSAQSPNVRLGSMPSFEIPGGNSSFSVDSPLQYMNRPQLLKDTSQQTWHHQRTYSAVREVVGKGPSDTLTSPAKCTQPQQGQLLYQIPHPSQPSQPPRQPQQQTQQIPQVTVQQQQQPMQLLQQIPPPPQQQTTKQFQQLPIGSPKPTGQSKPILVTASSQMTQQQQPPQQFQQLSQAQQQSNQLQKQLQQMPQQPFYISQPQQTPVSRVVFIDQPNTSEFVKHLTPQPSQTSPPSYYSRPIQPSPLLPQYLQTSHLTTTTVPPSMRKFSSDASKSVEQPKVRDPYKSIDSYKSVDSHKTQESAAAPSSRKTDNLTAPVSEFSSSIPERKMSVNRMELKQDESTMTPFAKTAVKEFSEFLRKQNFILPAGPLCDNEYLLRFLKFNKFENYDETFQQIVNHCAWLKDVVPKSTKDSANCLPAGLMYVYGKDKFRNPILVFRVWSLFDLPHYASLVVSAYWLELLKAAYLTNGSSFITVIADFENVTQSNFDETFFCTLLGDLLQNYPEYFATFFVVNLQSTLKSMLVSLPYTNAQYLCERVKFIDIKTDIHSSIHPNQLERKYGGWCSDVTKFDVAYWPSPTEKHEPTLPLKFEATVKQDVPNRVVYKPVSQESKSDMVPSHRHMSVGEIHRRESESSSGYFLTGSPSLNKSATEESSLAIDNQTDEDAMSHYPDNRTEISTVMDYEEDGLVIDADMIEYTGSTKKGTFRRHLFESVELRSFEVDALNDLNKLLELEGICLVGTPVNPDSARLRFLQSTLWNPPLCTSAIISHLSWLAENPIVHQSEMAAELSLGLVYIFGRDRDYRPIIVCRVKNLKNTTIQQAFKLLLYWIGYSISNLFVPGKVEQFTVLVDLNGVSIFELPIFQAKDLARQLYENFPERLHQMFFVNTSFLFRGYWSTIASSLPKSTQDKISLFGSDFAKELQPAISSSQLEKSFGGMRKNVTHQMGGFYRPSMPSTKKKRKDQSLN